MAKEASGRIRHVIADSAAFLKNAPLNDMCENVYTVEEVVSEIRDAASRQRLAMLPYTIQFRQPSSEALRAGTIKTLRCCFITLSSKALTTHNFDDRKSVEQSSFCLLYDRLFVIFGISLAHVLAYPHNVSTL